LISSGWEGGARLFLQTTLHLARMAMATIIAPHIRNAATEIVVAMIIVFLGSTDAPPSNPASVESRARK